MKIFYTTCLLLLAATSQANDHSDLLNSLLSVPQPVVEIPPGEYRIDQPIQITHSDQWIDARGVTLSPTTGFTGEAILVAAGTQAARLKNVTVQGLRIQCKTKPIVGIRSEWTSYLILDQCKVIGSSVQAAVIREGWDTHLVRSQFFQSGSREPELACLELSASAISSTTGTRTITLDAVTVGDYPGVGILAVNQYSLMASQTKIHHSHSGDSIMGLRCEGCVGVRFNGLIVARRYRAFEFLNCHDFEVDVIDTSRQ